MVYEQQLARRFLGAFAELGQTSGPLGSRLEERLRRATGRNDSSGPKRKALGPLTLAPLPLLEVRDRLLDKAEVGGLVEARAEEVAREIGLEQAPEVRAGVT